MSDGIGHAEEAVFSEQAQQSLERVLEIVDWLQISNGGVFEDWGCGHADPKGPWVKHAMARNGVPKMQYVGVDKSPGPGVDVVADLVHRRASVASIFLHHVLGISGYWEMILDNALYSFRQRLAVVESSVLLRPAVIIPVLKIHAWPYQHEVLPDGRDAYLVERR